MYFGKLVDVLVVALSMSSLAQASFFGFGPRGQDSSVGEIIGDVLNVRRALDFLGREIREIVYRQNKSSTSAATASAGPTSSSTTTTSSSSSSSSSSTSTTSTSTSTSSSSSTSETSTSSTTTPASAVPPPITATPTSTPAPTSPTSTSSQPLETTVLTSFVTLTNSDGSPTATQKTEATSVVPASLANDGSNSSSGMSTQTRNTVIGVVVGIGGAIILIGLGLVAWRIWGRRKSPEETDGLMASYNAPYNQPEKSDVGGSASSRTPFQSTLESYHAAPGPVNTASNF